jgi:hypothetical protein
MTTHDGQIETIPNAPSNAELASHLGRRLHFLRAQLGLNQEQVGSLLNIHRSHMCPAGRQARRFRSSRLSYVLLPAWAFLCPSWYAVYQSREPVSPKRMCVPGHIRDVNLPRLPRFHAMLLGAWRQTNG